MRWRLAAVLLLLPAAAQAGGVTATDGWMRYLLPSLPAAGYLTLRNDTAAPVVLDGAASPACGTLMLHESKDDSGMATMMDVPALTIPPGGSVSFAPGGYHLMCMQPRMKVRDKVAVTLRFAGGAMLAVTLPVHGASGP